MSKGKPRNTIDHIFKSAAKKKKEEKSGNNLTVE